jgi:hypothetical protein
MDGGLPSVDSGFSLAELEAQITELAGHLNAANYRWLSLIAEFDRRKGWCDGALHSCAHWLNFKCGLDLGAAREKVRVAHALEGLPRICVAMANGQLSYSKARALTRVACPATEEYFLSMALHGTAHHVETLVRHYRRCRETEALSSEVRQQAMRSLSYCFDDDGSLVIKARLPAIAGAMLIKALDAAMKQSLPGDAAGGLSVGDIDEDGHEVRRREVDIDAGLHGAPNFWMRPHPRSVRRADALALLAETYLKRAPPTLKTADRYQVVVHVDAQTLRNSTPGRCEIEHGPSLPAETARRLACDASLVRIIENANGEPLDIGRKTRSIPPAIRRALTARDRGCRFPGCTHTQFVDAHHVKHWAEGGETKASNLLLLCRFHHRLVHEGGIVIQRLDDGALRFVRPNGRAFDPVVQLPAMPMPGAPASWSLLAESQAKQGIHIDRGTAATLWRGERMDYGLAIQVLLQKVERARDVSAETFSPGVMEHNNDVLLPDDSARDPH